jgi:hypothetical protein
LSVDLSDSEGGWEALMDGLGASGQDKYVALDLSACEMSGTVFNTDGNGGGKSKVVSLTLPDAAQTIHTGSAGSGGAGDLSAFRDFNNLTEVSGAGITRIPNYAFYERTSLTTVSFPAATEITGPAAFYGCTALTTVNFPAAKDIGPRTFHNCTALETVNFPAVTNIGGDAFNGCTSLTTAYFAATGTNTRSIGELAFNGCTSLTTVSFPAVTTIRYNAFANTGTTVALEITMGQSAPALETGIFSGVTATKNVIVKVPHANAEAWAAAGYTTGTADDTWTTRFTNGSGINLTITYGQAPSTP